jgi:hypothetical protein
MRQFGWVALFLALLLGFFFRDGFLPGRTVASNDGPLGAISSACGRLPSGFLGYWQDLNWLGGTGPSASPDVSNSLAFVSGPLIFSKIYAPFALLFLGLSTWLCFRQWKLSPLACILGAAAAALNSDFFSTACWGVASQPLSFGCDFLALAALADETSPRRIGGRRNDAEKACRRRGTPGRGGGVRGFHRNLGCQLPRKHPDQGRRRHGPGRRQQSRALG